MPKKNETLSPFRYARFSDLTPRRSLEEPIDDKYSTQLHPGWKDAMGCWCVKLPDWIIINNPHRGKSQDVGGNPQITDRANFHKRVKLARLELIEFPEHSNTWIAEDMGLNNDTIGKMRKDLEANSEIPKLIQLVGRDGKYHPRGHRGRKNNV